MGDGYDPYETTQESPYGSAAPKLGSDAYATQQQQQQTTTAGGWQSGTLGGDAQTTRPWRSGYGQVAPAFSNPTAPPDYTNGGRSGYGQVAPGFNGGGYGDVAPNVNGGRAPYNQVPGTVGGNGEVYSIEQVRSWLDQTRWRLVEHKLLGQPASLVIAEATGEWRHSS